MKQIQILLVLALALSVALTAAPPPAQGSLDGEWKVEIAYDKIGEFVFDFACENGALTGKVQRGDKGTEEISEGTCSAKEFEFQVKADKDVWLWSGSMTEDGKLRCRRQKQGKDLRQTLIAVR